MSERVLAPIPFDSQQASGLEALSGAPELMANTLSDLANTRKARPGISAWESFPSTIPNASPVLCMAALGDILVYVTADRHMWACRDDEVFALSGVSAATRLAGSLRPMAETFRDELIIVGGGAPSRTDGTGFASLLGGSPPDSFAVTGIATRAVLAPFDASGTFRWSDPGDSGHATWDPLNFAEAEAKPDVVQNIASNTNELFIFSTQTIQAFSPDASVTFAPGRTLNVGLLAPYSLVEVDDQFAFLDRERRFVLTDGRTFSDEESVLSKPIESVLRGMTTVDDCWGFRMRNDRWDAVVWFFPTEGRGFMWNRRNRGWSEWRAWGSTGWTTPNITSAYYWPEQNVFLVGLETGQIAKLDSTAFTDLGQPIKVELVSGFMDSGSQNQKKYVSAKFKFKRGQTAQSGTAPKVYIYRRHDTGPWMSPTVRDLGLAGDYEPVVEIRSLGIGRQIQFRLEFDAAADFTLVSAQLETVTLSN